MKRIFLTLMILLIAVSGHCASEWDKNEVAGTRNVSDIDAYIITNNTALDRMLSNYRQGAKIKYLSSLTLTVETGAIMCSNAGGTTRRMRANTSDVTVAWTEIDTGAEANSTTYYLYAVADADSDNFTVIISANSSTPQGGESYYKRLGSFYNNSDGDIEQIKNDDESFVVSSGVIANAATISLPSGYLEDECNWLVSIGNVDPSEAQARGMDLLDFTATDTRVVTADWATRNWVDSGANFSGTGTANFMIICYR